MADFNQTKSKIPPNQSASDRPERRKDTRRLAWFTAGLILTLTLLLLCIIPGSPALGVLLKLPEKAQPVITTLQPIAFDPVGPSSGGGSIPVEFPVGSSIIVDVPPDLTTPPPGPFPTPRRWPDCVQPASAITTDPTKLIDCPTSSIPKPPPSPDLVKIPKEFDFGDAPDKPKGGFPSLLSSAGARHFDVSRFYIGKRVDVEGNSKQVDKDSATPPEGVGPDDGLNITINQLGPGAAAPVVDGVVEIHNNNWPEEKPIYLNALYDFNNNLRWDIPDEHIITDYELHIPPGQSLYGTILSLSVKRLNWLRVTVTDIPLGAGFNGSWPKAFDFGETEDYFQEELYPVHIVAGSHLVFTSEDREHKWGPSQVHAIGTTYGVPTEGGGRPRLGSGPLTVDMTKPTPQRPIEPGQPTPTPTPGSGEPKFNPFQKYTISALTNPVTGKGPAVVGYDPATGVYRFHDGVDSRFGDAVDDDFLRVHGIPLVPKPIFSITLPTQGGFPVVNIFPISTFLNNTITQIKISNLEHEISYLGTLPTRQAARIQTIQKEIQVLKEVLVPVPVQPTPTPGGVSTQYKVEVVSINTSTGSTKIRATGYLDGNNNVILSAYSKSGTKIDVRSVPFDVASIIFDYIAPAGAVSIQAQLEHSGNPVPGAVATFPSVAVITGGGSITGGPQCQLTITLDDTLADGTASSAYTGTISASGGTSPYTYAVTAGSLPTGLSLSSSGSLTGTPTAAATYAFTVTATDANGCTGSQSYSITIASACPTASVGSNSYTAGQDGRAYNEGKAISLSSGSGTGSTQALNMPPGVDINISGSPGSVITWTIDGTPIGVGNYSFTARIAVAGCGNLDTPLTWEVTP